MVRSKDAPKKKPRDPLLTPPAKLRGAAMSPAPASVPNYMRATSSSDAKGGRRRARVAAPASASPATRRTAVVVRGVTRGKVLFPDVSGPALGRATCSSTLKAARFPDALDLVPGATDADGPAAMRVCPYTYCSLNGHAHAPAVPLRSFLASRRRLIQTQQSMKLKGVSAFRKKSGDKNGAPAGKITPLIDEEAVGDFFVEVYAGPRVSLDMSSSDMSMDEMDATVRKMEFVVFDRCSADEDSEKGEEPVICAAGDGRLEEKRGADRDSSSVCSDAVISGDFIEELPWMRYHGYEYDSLDDGISEEHRTRDDEINGARISEEQRGSGCEEMAAGEHEANDDENISNLVLESGIAVEHEGVACTVEACQELDRRDEDHTLYASCHGEPSAGQVTAEQNFSDALDNSDIPDQEVAAREDSSILEESCLEETSADQQAKDYEYSAKSDGGSEVTPDDGSEMEISEDAVSNDGCREDFSEEVTSKAISAEDVLEQHCNIIDESAANDVFEQDGNPEKAQSDAQTEYRVSTSEIENASEGSDIIHNIMYGVKDAHKEIEVTTSEKEESCEESGTAHGSNPDSISLCFDDGAQTEVKVICMLNNASEESDVSQGRNLDDNTEYFGVDQGTAENDDSVVLKDDSQNDDSEMAEYRLGDASKYSFTTREAEQGDSPANALSGAQNESNQTTSEPALGIREDTGTESKLTTCQPEDVSEDCCISQESDHDGSSPYFTDGIQNEYEFTTFHSEGNQEDSDVIKEHESKSDSAYSEKKLESTACESGDASERPSMSQEADSTQKDITLKKWDVSEDIQIVEETNELLNVEILEPKYDCTVEGHVEAHNIAPEVTDAKEPSIDDICDAFKGMNLKGDVYFDPDESTLCPRNKLIISRRRRTPEEEEYMRGFNPRAPNFLPPELDPDAEKVDLRHQMVDERKNAEEWMIDFALRRAVTNLAPARKKKVELLVQAFETVLPHDEDYKKSMTPPRHVQACN